MKIKLLILLGIIMYIFMIGIYSLFNTAQYETNYLFDIWGSKAIVETAKINSAAEIEITRIQSKKDITIKELQNEIDQLKINKQYQSIDNQMFTIIAIVLILSVVLLTIRFNGKLYKIRLKKRYKWKG